jgi:hypothetical protein
VLIALGFGRLSIQIETVELLVLPPLRPKLSTKRVWRLNSYRVMALIARAVPISFTETNYGAWRSRDMQRESPQHDVSQKKGLDKWQSWQSQTATKGPKQIHGRAASEEQSPMRPDHRFTW